MRGTSSWVLVYACAVAACGTGDNRVDPGDLELRDLLGVGPEAATAWNADERAAARRVLTEGARAEGDARVVAGDAGPIDDRVVRALVTIDGEREQLGRAPLAIVRVAVGSDAIDVRGVAAGFVRGDATSAVTLDERWQREPWGTLVDGRLDVATGLAGDAGWAGGALVIAPAPRLPAVAAYVGGARPRLLVNPVVLAAFEPTSELAATARSTSGAGESIAPPRNVAEGTSAATGANPYSFYGSYEECAAAQRTRCEACLPSSSCTAVTSGTDGNSECTMLGANGGRGYYLLCINLSLAISSVDACTADAAPGCARDTKAADSLSTLEANADFLDMQACSTGLDACLTKIYGAPRTTFPGPDGGTATEPPRSTNVSCGDSFGNNNNCSASPSCDCSGPSCNNSLSCDSGCSSSNGQSGCGGNCDSCSSSGGGGSTSGGSCSSSGGSTSSSSACGSCSSGSGGCGSCGGSGSSSGCGGSSNSNGCSVAPTDPSAGFAVALSIAWGMLPIPAAAFARRRARRKKRARGCTEVAS